MKIFEALISEYTNKVVSSKLYSGSIYNTVIDSS